MNLTDFTEQIDWKIVDRGYNYFLNDLVDEPKQISDGVWRAMVHGSESYRVEIHTDRGSDGDIIKWECDCPYDFGPVCKHVVAVLYTLADQQDDNPPGPDKKANSGTKTELTSSGKLQKIFEAADKEDLQEFIKVCFDSVSGLKNHFLAHFAEFLGEDPAFEYRTIIRSYIRVAEGRSGFIDYHSAPTLTRHLGDLNQKADDLLAAGKTVESMAICRMLIEEVSLLFESTDDSDGEIDFVIRFAFDTLRNITDDASFEGKEDLFEWCMQEYPLPKYQEYGLDNYFLELLPYVVSTEDQETQFFEFLDRRLAHEKNTSRYPDFGITQLMKSKISYLIRHKRDGQLLPLLEAHKYLPEYREMLIDRAIEKKDFDAAKKLCREGLKNDKESALFSMGTPWQEKLFDIAGMENDQPELRKLAEDLFYDSRYSMKWYHELKKIWPDEEWPEKCEALIDSVRNRYQGKGYMPVSALAQIYAEEGFTDRLLKIIQQNPVDITLVEQYTSKLSGEFPEELLDMYEQCILEEARQTGRKVYRQVARRLQRVTEIRGGDERAYALFQQILGDYSNRPAMKEEFGRIFPQWMS